MSVALLDKAAKNRERATRRSRDLTESIADIGDIPPVVNKARRAACRGDLLLFLQTYFPQSTGAAPFSPDHLRVIDRLERCILEGGRFCNAVYRGFAKTTISTNAAIWAVLYGHRKYVAVFSANEPQAKDLIAGVKSELEENDLLFEDFPETCHAVRELEGKAQRCASQRYKNNPTHIGWRSDRVVLPVIPGSRASGAILVSRGMTGSGTRGLLHTRPDGIKQRPDFAIIDDPQTEESASTGGQITKRLSIINKSIMKLSGHRGKPMSCVVNGTVIAQDDVIVALLNPAISPAWQGERIKMVRSWSKAHDTLWMEQYASRRNTFDRDDPEDQKRAHREATAFYIANREAMDEGCRVSWQHCYYADYGEVSAIQHAYNMLIDDGADVFASECQNEPITADDATGFLTTQQIQGKTNGYERGAFPTACTALTAFIDCQQDSLWWMVCAWEPSFTGYVIDYGCWPQQNRSHYSKRNLRHTLAMRYPKMGAEAAIHAGLSELTDNLFGRKFVRDDGATMPINRLLVDSGDFTETIYSFVRQSKHANILPSKGIGVTAGNAPWSEIKPKPGEVVGLNWIKAPVAANRAIRLVRFDANSWKTFVQLRLATAVGDKGCLSLFKATHYDHRMIAEHLTAETPFKTEGRGRTLWEWKLPANRPDNELLDCLTGCAVAASMERIVLAENKSKNTERKRLSLAEMAARARG